MKTPKSKLKANAKYEQKLKRRNVIFKESEHSSLLRAIDNDPEPFSSLVIKLLKNHYNDST